MLNSKLAMKKRLLHKYRIEPSKNSLDHKISNVSQLNSSESGHSVTPEQENKDIVVDEPIDVETVTIQLPTFHPTNCSLVDTSDTDTVFVPCRNLNQVSKPSLEEVVARCHLKSSEVTVESNDLSKSAIESLRDVVNNVSTIESPPSSRHSSTDSEPTTPIPSSTKRSLTPHAKSILSEWFRKHLYRPYPTFEEKKELADLCGISSSKVDTWFANKRNRTHNTKKLPPKYSSLLNLENTTTHNIA